MKKALWIIPAVVGVAVGACLLVKNKEKANEGFKQAKKGVEKIKHGLDKSAHWAKLKVDETKENVEDVIESIKHPEKFDPHNVEMTEQEFI